MQDKILAFDAKRKLARRSRTAQLFEIKRARWSLPFSDCNELLWKESSIYK